MPSPSDYRNQSEAPAPAFPAPAPNPEAATAALANLETQLSALLDQQPGLIGKGGASNGKAVISAVVATLTAALIIVPVIRSVVTLPGQSCPPSVVFDPNGVSN